MAFFFKGVTPSALRQEFGFTARSQDPLCFGHLPRLAGRVCFVAINLPHGQPVARARHGSRPGSTVNPVPVSGRSRWNAGCCSGSKRLYPGGFLNFACRKKHCLPKRNRRGQVEETCNPSGDSSENVMSDNSRYSRQRLHSHAVRDGVIIQSLINQASVIFAVTLL